MKPILFNTDMVRAILAGRKTATRRVVKPQPLSKIAYACMGYKHGTWGYPDKDAWKYWNDDNFRLPDNLPDGEKDKRWTPPCHIGDILYVRETWVKAWKNRNEFEYIYKANVHTPDPLPIKWKPSIHMPREAARLFLRVTDVRVERLQQTMERGPLSAQAEGFVNDINIINGGGKSATKHFSEFWDSTIKKPADRALYGWAANPWVWVVAFERCEKQEENK